MEASYEVRYGTNVNLDALQSIERAAAVLFPHDRLPDPDDVMPKEELQRAMRQGLLLVGYFGDWVVGFAVAKVEHDHLYLAEMSVHPEHARRGVGTRMVKLMIEEAKRRRLKGVALTTFEDLPWNAPFYSKLGFRVLADWEMTPALRDVLAKERLLGFTNRVAMVYPNAA